MVRLILEILALIVVLGGVALLGNYLIFFWINKRRLWKKEDEIFNAKKKQEALQELIETQNLLNEAKDSIDWTRTYTLKDTSDSIKK
jgi:type II secretory pathway pseudopilin PulG